MLAPDPLDRGRPPGVALGIGAVELAVPDRMVDRAAQDLGERDQPPGSLDRQLLECGEPLGRMRIAEQDDRRLRRRVAVDARSRRSRELRGLAVVAVHRGEVLVSAQQRGLEVGRDRSRWRRRATGVGTGLGDAIPVGADTDPGGGDATGASDAIGPADAPGVPRTAASCRWMSGTAAVC